MSAHQQLIREYRVPEPLLRRFAGEVEKRVCAKFEERINALERQVADLAEREHIWRQKHFKADKARQDAELLLGVRERVVAELTEKVAKQSAEIAKLRKQIYGESSERTMPIHTAQDDTAKGTSVGAAGVPSKRKRGKQPGAKGFGRRTEEGLERVAERHSLASHECPLCGLPYDQCPDEKSEEVDIQEKVFIREHYREKARRVCRCPNEKVLRFTLAEAPSNLIPAGHHR